MNEYLSKYNWMLQDDYVITTLLKEEYDVASLKNDLGFINLMNVTLENIIKTNILIKPIEI